MIFRGVVLMALAALMFTGCGGGDEPGDEPEADARAAVADFTAAVATQDMEAACEGLTADAQEQVTGEVANALEQAGDQVEQGSDCPEVLAIPFEAPGAEKTLSGLDEFADQIRSGNAPGGKITVAIAEDTGTVTIATGSSLLPVPVEKVGDAWLVADARGLLFGVETGG